jgi:short-subunit dehydrogenase
VITGGTDGIGKQFALQLAEKGLNICIISRCESKLKDVAKELGNLQQCKNYHRNCKFLFLKFTLI